MVRVAGHAGVRRRRDRPPARGRPQPRRDDRGDRRGGARADAAPDRRASSACCGRRSPSTGSGSRPAPTSTRATARSSTERFRRQIFPVLTPLAVGLGRPFPYISNLSLSLAVLVRDPQTAQETFARVKVPKEMLPRFVPVGDGQHVRPAREPDRRAPRRALPGHGDRRLRRLPRHARRRLHGRRRGRRPAPRRRAGAAPAPLRRGRAGRGRRRHEPAPARAARARAGDRGGRAVRGRRPARPQGPVGHRRRLRLRRPARRAVDAGDPAAPAARRGRGARRAGRDAQGRHPRPPPLRLVRDLGRAARRAGGRRSEGARDQADRVPHERRLAARPGADPRRRARQAGGLPRGAQGALRRAREHRLGARHGGGGRARRLRPADAQDPRQVRS